MLCIAVVHLINAFTFSGDKQCTDHINSNLNMKTAQGRSSMIHSAYAETACDNNESLEKTEKEI